MILTKAHFSDKQQLEADLCIIGSGPAAISVALSFAQSRINVIVISGGGWSESVPNQDLYRGSVAPGVAHESLEENRRRQFGGTSAAWGGRCIPFEPVDFKPRSWVPDSGWPITYDDLLPYYQRAAEVCQIGRYEYDAQAAFPKNGREIIEGLDTEDIVSYPLERWSPPVHFAKTYRTELESSSNLRILLDAHVLSLRMQKGPNQISHIDVAMGNLQLTVKAPYFVLATGGIENARLLLASANDYFPAGIGNQHDNVGRYYMAHLDGTYVEVKIRDKEKLRAGFERDAGGVYCRRRWWITESAQKAHQLLNTIFFLYHPNTQNGHRDVVFSSIYVAKSMLAVLRQKSLAKAVSKAKQLLPSVKEHTVNVLKNGLSQTPDMIRLGLKRMEKRRLPYVLPSKRNEYWGVYFQAEQMPNRDSRVYLSTSDKDAYGIPRPEVHIAFTKDDVESVVKAHQLFVENFRQKNLGEIYYDETELRQYLTNQINSFNSSAHHIGTTRMSVDPRTGVVDQHYKVHGLTNLFVAGSSVFPTGGHANPTLTIVANALRLAEYLQGILQREPQPSEFHLS